MLGFTLRLRQKSFLKLRLSFFFFFLFLFFLFLSSSFFSAKGGRGREEGARGGRRERGEEGFDLEDSRSGQCSQEL